ncbi:MAG: hypothetical protein O3C40_27880 [Planctomycetota bacterium]|nr:hypothetical protein [Planctomycetota bacterium]
MASDSAQQGTPDVSTLSSAIETLIFKTRRLLRSTWVATGTAVAVGLFFATLAVVALFDLALPLWPAFRFAALLLVAVPTIGVIFIGIVRPLVRRLTEAMVARRIEQELPGIHNRLVSCIDLSRNGQRPHSQGFHHRLIHEAYDRVSGFRPRRVLDLLSLRRASIFAAVGVVTLVLAFVVFSDRLPIAVSRIFFPFADIPPASGVLYDVLVDDRTEPGDHETLRGEDVDFTVLLRKGEVDPPGSRDALRLDIQTVDHEGRQKNLTYNFAELDDNKTYFKLTGLQHSFSYRVRGGGTWSKKHRVTMLDRPRIVNLQTAVYYPKYMRIPEPRLGRPQSADVSGPVESTVEVTVQVEGDASEGEIELLQRQSKFVDVLDREERIWFGDEMPSGATPHGTWEYDEALIGARGHSDPVAAEQHNHGFEAAPIGFEVQTGQVLFTHVYLQADQIPESIMLKFHDGTNWEHRAFWGADKIAEGTIDTPSRRNMGALPSGGKLVRLEVPAKDVDLENKRIHGVSFALFGGEAVWGATGSLPPAQKRVNALVATESFLLAPRESTSEEVTAANTWSGRFPLLRNGFYRVVMRNKLDYPNQQMQEGKLTAIPDMPPQVVIERPGQDLLVSKPVKVPIYISAYDDFGLEDIVISVQKGDTGTFQGRPVKRYDKPKRSETTVVTLDLEEEAMKLGESLIYRVEVRDGRGQSATTKDYVIRMAEDNNAADRQLAAQTERTKTFEEKLAQLISEQAKVEEAVERVAENYKPLTEKVEQAKVEAAKQAEVQKVANPDQPVEPKPIELDDESKKELDALRTELAEIVKQEDQNIQLSQQLATEAKQLADAADNLQMLPPEIAEQLRNAEQAFQQMAVQPMQQLRELMNQSAQPAQMDPKLPEAERQSDQVAQNLEDLQTRMEALAKAQRESENDVEQALADLRSDLLQQDAELTARDLADLRDFIEAMKKDLDVLKGSQEELIADNENDLSDRLLEKLLEAQDDLDEEAMEKLADARELQDMKAMRRLRSPDFPARPYDPERDSYLIPPKEQDTEGEDGDEKPTEGEDAEAEKNEGDEEMEDEPELFLPLLGGPTPKMDERFKENMRAVAKKKKEQGDEDGENEKQEQLRSRQFDRLEELDMAAQALASDEQSLEEMLGAIEAAMPEGSPLTPEQMQQLREMMNGKNQQQAQAMFERMQQMLAQAMQQKNQGPTQAQLPTSSALNPIGNQEGVIGGVELILVDLDDLPVGARVVIMKMQPKEREELLQGLREEGPEGYRHFIKDYFRRLTEVQGSQP